VTEADLFQKKITQNLLCTNLLFGALYSLQAAFFSVK